MITRFRSALLACAALSLGCVGPTLESRRDAARPAIAAIQQGNFDVAERLAGERISADGEDPYGRLVRAIVRYKKAVHQLFLDGRTTFAGGLAAGGLNQKFIQTTFRDAESELAAVEADLAIVARQRGLSMEICLACWEIDWNGDGRVDERDHRLFQIEQDAQGEPIPEDDPRRKPTFRFDDGDVAWARAFVSFERAALDVVLAYDLGGVNEARVARHKRIVLRLVDPDRIAQARRRILEGLEQSDASRRAYLAETDDDREWVPNPRQKSHPMPLPVDQALYDTWEGVVGDLQRLVRGEEGLHAGDLLALLGERMKHPPRGYLDVGRMLSHPKDIVLDLADLGRLERGRGDVEITMSAVFGEYYVPEMKPSPLSRRLARMKGEMDSQKEDLEHKLRYLFWLN